MVTRTVCCDATFVHPRKTRLNFSVAFEKDYKEKFSATIIVDIMEDMISSDFLTRMSAQFNYRYIRVARMILKQNGVPAVLECLNDEDPVSKRLGILLLNHIRLYTATREEL